MATFQNELCALRLFELMQHSSMLEMAWMVLMEGRLALTTVAAFAQNWDPPGLRHVGSESL
jgi:hypothetical protein